MIQLGAVGRTKSKCLTETEHMLSQITFYFKALFFFWGASWRQSEKTWTQIYHHMIDLIYQRIPQSNRASLMFSSSHVSDYEFSIFLIFTSLAAKCCPKRPCRWVCHRQQLLWRPTPLWSAILIVHILYISFLESFPDNVGYPSYSPDMFW